MNSPISLTVVIPTYKRTQDLRLCLVGLQIAAQYKEDATVRVIITDDSPDDITQKMVAAEFPQFEWIQGPQKGPASNRNNGVSHASSEWILFLDDDCLPQPNWLHAYISKIKQSPELKLLEGKTLANRPQWTLDEESPINETGGYLWSCNFAVKKDVFDSLDGFDEDFPSAAMEDVDFRMRLQKSGHRPLFVEQALVIHPWRPRKSLSFDKKRHESFLYLVSKHPELARNGDIKGHYRFVGLRTLIKVTLPGLIKFRGRGFLKALQRDFFVLLKGI